MKYNIELTELKYIIETLHYSLYVITFRLLRIMMNMYRTGTYDDLYFDNDENDDIFNDDIYLL